MATTLYFSPGTCALAPHIALELTGQPFEAHVVKFHRGEHRTPEFLALNPAGQVPVLLHNGQAIAQIVAIVLYLDALHPQAGLLPQDLLPRTRALETLAWLNNTVHPTFNRVFKPQHSADDPATQAAVRAKAQQTYAGLMAQLQAKVQAAQAQGHAFLAGHALCAVDAYALAVIRWAALGGLQPQQRWPALWAYAGAVAAHPAAVRAMQRERIGLDVEPIA